MRTSQPFEISVPEGTLHGRRGGEGPPALLLHGGAAVPDYLGPLADELGALFATMRYTQRGTPPSLSGPPYTIEAHMADALAVLDHFGIERAWVVGHSWGGHLALHLAVSHADRLLGVIAIDPLGAFGDVFAELDANLRAKLSREQVARIDEIEAKRRAGDVTEAEIVERFALVWPAFFVGPQRVASEPPERIGVAASIGTNRSIAAHFEARTLANGLPGVRLPVLFVHGELDPLPLRSSTETAALIPDAEVEIIGGCGHFPWLEQPGAVRLAVLNAGVERLGGRAALE
jgi:pimeloyl-ACP methyl ester carboxylesterase